MGKTKNVNDSTVTMTELILPNDANSLGNLLGGKLMHWIDIAGAMAASRHSNRTVATISVDELVFKEPVKIGEILVIEAGLTWVGRTSMEVKVRAFAENYHTGEKRAANTAYLVYVALDEEGRPAPVPELELDTDEEKQEFADAEKRRAIRINRSERLKKSQ